MWRAEHEKKRRMAQIMPRNYSVECTRFHIFAIDPLLLFPGGKWRAAPRTVSLIRVAMEPVAVAGMTATIMVSHENMAWSIDRLTLFWRGGNAKRCFSRTWCPESRQRNRGPPIGRRHL